jgi:hypothetical protein
MDELNQDELSEMQVMGLIARGKVVRDAIPRERRSALMREINGLRKSRGGGRPRTVEHAPGPRGGCRCADCRTQGSSEDRGRRGIEYAETVGWD